MGREIKRVALDFKYPINKMIWKGYHNPYRGLECKCCDGTGMSEEFKKIDDSWYSFSNPELAWHKNITQDEVQALLDADRLWDFTRVPITDEQKEIVKTKIENGGNSWLPFNNGYVPTAEEVNKWAAIGFGHDAQNRWICVKQRAKRLGIEKMDCETCEGSGQLWPDDKYKELCDNFEGVDPPAGEGYQLWSTTTEGTPMSPVFATPEELATWLYENKASSFGSSTCSYDTWLKFIKDSGFALSMVADINGIMSGVEAVVG